MTNIKLAAIAAGVLGMGWMMSARGALEPASPITIPDGDNWGDFIADGFVPMQYEPQLDNLTAFLALIRAGESSDDYFVTVGGGHFTSTDDHPSNTGEFEGIRRADGRLSTAAGAYQITRTTWQDIGGVSRFGDFSPMSQDAAAIFLLNRRGALSDVNAGRVSLAISKLRNEWEFFTKWSVTKSTDIYLQNGGNLA